MCECNTTTGAVCGYHAARLFQQRDETRDQREEARAEVKRLLAEVERLNAVIGEAVRAYYELKDREDGYSGHGREGHLNERDLYLLRDALGLTPPWVCSGCGAPGSPLRPCELCGTTVVRSAGSTDG